MNHAQSAKFETKVRFRKRSFTSWKKMRNQSIQFTCIVIIITTYLLPHLQFTLFVFSLGRCVSSHNVYYIVACEQALMTRVSCPRGDLRQVGKRFAGGLALDPSLARGAQGFTGNGPAEALIITSLQDKTHDQTNDGRKVAEKFLYKS